jgi:hypothetical protein
MTYAEYTSVNDLLAEFDPDPEQRKVRLVLVTGSRTWNRPAVIWDRLDGLLAEHGPQGRCLIIINGMAKKGVDLFAHVWTGEQHQINPMAVKEWPFPISSADWAKFGRSAGHMRNDEMARLGADYCLAWVQQCLQADCRRPGVHGTHGASDCVARARTYGVPNIELVESWTEIAVPDPDLL